MSKKIGHPCNLFKKDDYFSPKQILGQCLLRRELWGQYESSHPQAPLIQGSYIYVFYLLLLPTSVFLVEEMGKRYSVTQVWDPSSIADMNCLYLPGCGPYWVAICRHLMKTFLAFLLCFPFFNYLLWINIWILCCMLNEQWVMSNGHCSLLITSKKVGTSALTPGNPGFSIVHCDLK